jgi:hypothetical protein
MSNMSAYLLPVCHEVQKSLDRVAERKYPERVPPDALPCDVVISIIGTFLHFMDSNLEKMASLAITRCLGGKRIFCPFSQFTSIPIMQGKLSFGGRHAIHALAVRSSHVSKDTAAAPHTHPAAKKRTLFFDNSTVEAVAEAPPPPPAKKQTTITTVITLMPATAAAPPVQSQLLNAASSWCELRELEPVSIQAAILLPETVKEPLVNWVRGRLAQAAEGPKLALLTGPSGCGKSTFVRTVCKVLNVQCVVPDVNNLADLVRTLKEDVCTAEFKLGRKSGGVRPRVWLFSGVDGYFRAAKDNGVNNSKSIKGAKPPKTPSQLLEDIFKLLGGATAKLLPPIVFTMHDFEGPAMFALRKSPLAVQFRVRRPDPQNVAQRAMCARVITRLCMAANQPARTDVVLEEAMAGFDGDLKQLMLRGESALRQKSDTVTSGFAPKDTELVDAFYTLRLVFNTHTKVPVELLANVFDTFALMPVLITKNYAAALPRAGNPKEEAQAMAAVASMADAFSELDMYDPYWAVKDLQSVGRIYALSSVRFHRESVRAVTLPENTKLDCTARRPFGGSKYNQTLNKYRMHGDPADFRRSGLECVERLAMDPSVPSPFF